MSDLDFTLTQEFRAPRALVFRHWTNAEDIAAWFAPDTFEVTGCEADARPGGAWMVRYQAPGGEPIEERGAYLTIDAPALLEFTLQHHWASGGTGPELRCSVRFSETTAGTRVEFTQAGITSADMRDGMREGWRGCFGKLAHHIEAEVVA